MCRLCDCHLYMRVVGVNDDDDGSSGADSWMDSLLVL